MLSIRSAWTKKCLVRRMLIENVYLVDSPGRRNDEESGLYTIYLFEFKSTFEI